MTPTFSILVKSLVRQFYRQNAGQLIFVFILFIGAVGELEGQLKYTGPLFQFHYQYALILGMLSNRMLFALVFFAWLLYAEKCAQFVLGSLQQPDHSFLNLLSRLDKRKRFLVLLRVQIFLCLPISSYALAITGVAFYKGYPVTAIAVQLYILFLCLAGAWQYQHLLKHPGGSLTGWGKWMNTTIQKPWTRWLASGGRRGTALPYWSFFIRYLFQDGKALLLGLKLAGCSVLYLLLKDRDPDYYDIRMPFLLYTMVLFGHGVLIYRCRAMEEKRLSFYRGLPVSLGQRWVQYCLLYFLVLIPEMLTLSWLTPVAIHRVDAGAFILSGYSLLLLLNSVLFVAPLKMGEFLKLSLGIFGILYLGVLGGFVIALSGCCFVVAGCLFFGRYWRYQS